MLRHPTTAPLAALAGGSPVDRAHALTLAVDVIRGVEPPRRERLLDAAATLASIDLPLSIIEAALQEASMPVPMDELPLAHALKERYRAEFRAEARAELLVALLRRRFPDDVRVEGVATSLAALGDQEALDRIAGATRLEDLLP